MWNEPHPKTCRRPALHRLRLAAPLGRPDGLKDGAGLHRPAGMILAGRHADGRFRLTVEGKVRHATDVLKTRQAA